MVHLLCGQSLLAVALMLSAQFLMDGKVTLMTIRLIQFMLFGFPEKGFEKKIQKTAMVMHAYAIKTTMARSLPALSLSIEMTKLGDLSLFYLGQRTERKSWKLSTSNEPVPLLYISNPGIPQVQIYTVNI